MDISQRKRGQVWRNVLIDRPPLRSNHRTAMIYRLMEVQLCCETTSLLDASGAYKLNCSGVNQQHLRWKCVILSIVCKHHISIVTFCSGFYLPVILNIHILYLINYINDLKYFTIKIVHYLGKL